MLDVKLCLNQCSHQHTVSGVWHFSPNGVMTLVKNRCAASGCCKLILVHNASNKVITNYEQLNSLLLQLGWQPYACNQFTRQYHRGHDTADLITLPHFFGDLRSTHMYDLVFKTRSAIRVLDSSS